MRKTAFFFAAIFISTMVIFAVFLTSCSIPVFPDGSWGVDGAGSRIPGRNVIEQLQWLQENAQTGGNYLVLARENEPRIPGNNNFGISYQGRKNITVTIRSSANIPRQTLWLLGCGVMLNVGHTNTLILENINLQVAESSVQVYPIVEVYGGTLQMTNSAISGNDAGRGVDLTEGVLSMGKGAVIHSNKDGGVLAWRDSRIYMYENAAVRNNFAGLTHIMGFAGGGLSLHYNSILTMRDSAVIYANHSGAGGGILLHNNSHAFMYDNAAIRDNLVTGGGGGVFTWLNSTLNMHGDNVRISSNRTLLAAYLPTSLGGGVFLGFPTDILNISGGTIYGADAPASIANSAGLASSLFVYHGFVRVGSYSDSGGFIPCGLFSFNVQFVANTFRVLGGVLQ